jgi:ABC-type cobalamin/Fe3+-siderophores transport system ATPase subunit
MGRFRPARILWRRPGPRDLQAVDSYLESCDVDAFADRPVSQLSRGEKQRTWLAFCLAQEKRALLLNESLDASDFRARRSFFRVLAEVAAEGRMVVLATHDLGLAREFAGWVIVLDRGRVVYEELLTNCVEKSEPDSTAPDRARRGF